MRYQRNRSGVFHVAAYQAAQTTFHPFPAPWWLHLVSAFFCWWQADVRPFSEVAEEFIRLIIAESERGDRSEYHPCDWPPVIRRYLVGFSRTSRSIPFASRISNVMWNGDATIGFPVPAKTSNSSVTSVTVKSCAVLHAMKFRRSAVNGVNSLLCEHSSSRPCKMGVREKNRHSRHQGS